MEIKKILFITLSNSGDVILSLPALGALRSRFPQAQITLMVGPRPKGIIEHHPALHRVIIYDKHVRLREKIKLFFALARERFDIVIDLRNSLYGALLPAGLRTSPFLRVPAAIRHKKDENLYRVQKALRLKEPLTEPERTMVYISEADKAFVEALLKEKGIAGAEPLVIVGMVIGTDTRRWAVENFEEVCAALAQEATVVLTGVSASTPSAERICRTCGSRVVDLTGKTSLMQLAYLVTRARLVITTDNGLMHLASYLDRPVAALFGRSDESMYGPWSQARAVIRREVFCRPCEKAQCTYKTLACMRLITPREVIARSRELLAGKEVPPAHERFKRILLVRTDRIGDVVLSTPAIEALRAACPSAYIAMLVSPATREIVEANPFLDEVITYDKEGKHKSFLRTYRFARNLAKRRFDVAFVLHPTNRVHLVAWLAGIPRRVGFDRKCGWTLTDRLPHEKQLGNRHESEYTLEVLERCAIPTEGYRPVMPITPAAEKWAQELFAAHSFEKNDIVCAFHPGASCISKRWPIERFAEVADRLAEEYRCHCVIIAGVKDSAAANAMAAHMKHRPLNLAGKTSLSQMASVLKRSSLFISNDSGPVHIACAVGTPVISLFGRAQKGLGPRRWGPLGARAVSIHKASCTPCLAHECAKGFQCLQAITVQDVLSASGSLLSRRR